MVLVNRVGGFNLERPVLIQPGQIYWVDRDTDELCVEWRDGRVTRTPGFLCR